MLFNFKKFKLLVPQLIPHNCFGADYILKMQIKYNRNDRNLVSTQRRGTLAVYTFMNSNNLAKEFTAIRRWHSRIFWPNLCFFRIIVGPFFRLLVTDCKFLHLMLENAATQKTDSHLSDPQDSVEMVKNNKEIGLQCSLNNGDMKDGESVLSKEDAWNSIVQSKSVLKEDNVTRILLFSSILC